MNKCDAAYYAECEREAGEGVGASNKLASCLEFIGELFVWRFFTERTMHEIIETLLVLRDVPRDAELEALVRFQVLTIVGNRDARSQESAVMDEAVLRPTMRLIQEQRTECRDSV